MRTLVIAEHDGKKSAKSSWQCVAAAQDIKHPIDMMVLGHNCGDIARELSAAMGADKILCADHAELAHGIAENMVAAILLIAKDYSHIIFPATAFGKNIMARLGAKLDVQPISDVVKILANDQFVRPIYAGNAMATVQSSDAIKILSVRPANFPAAKSGGKAAMESVAAPTWPARAAKYISSQINQSSRPDLGSARVVVSGGRGLGSAENFKLVEQLADQLGAAIGASRAAVDAGFVPNDYQVGQTGKIVAPELYIAVGISGAIQHVAGMKDSKIIVAINKDGEAPIFQIADFGLVGDLFAVLPELNAAVAKIKSA